MRCNYFVLNHDCITTDRSIIQTIMIVANIQINGVDIVLILTTVLLITETTEHEVLFLREIDVSVASIPAPLSRLGLVVVALLWGGYIPQFDESGFVRGALKIFLHHSNASMRS